MRKKIIVLEVLCFLFCFYSNCLSGYAQEKLSSPNGRILVSSDSHSGNFSIFYKKENTHVLVTTIAHTGLKFSGIDSDFRIVSSSSIVPVQERYVMMTGKRRYCSNKGNQQVFHFKNDEGLCLDMEFRAYDDGVVFRYLLPQLNRSLCLSDENTVFIFQEGITRWTQKLNSAYEDFYSRNKGVTPQNTTGKWGFPALFEVSDSIYTLVTEANIDRGNCGSWLCNAVDDSMYKMEMAEKVNVSGRWNSPWRVAIIGSLSDIVESTLVTDVSAPCRLTDVSWIKPGVVSWIYWANNHGSKDYQIVKKYIDFAADFHLPYVLIDWEWDEMQNGGNLEDALRYAKEKNVDPLLWYNSSTAWCGAGPLYRLNTPEARKKEFKWLSSSGVKGIKVDFFNQDSVATMNYFIDILEDAAENHLLVNFHGATIPRGWQRTYPHMVSVEGVYGAEWYNNNAILTDSAAWHNCTLPFTRNVVGPMDYTPCTFTDSQYPHITSNGHELALLIIFESSLQHLADCPEGYKKQPAEVQSFISSLPTVWDDTKLIGGYPSEFVVMARRKGNTWYIAGLNGTNKERTLPVDLSLIKDEIKQITLFSDGNNRDKFEIQNLSLCGKLQHDIACLPRGGFVMEVHLKEKY